VPERAGCTADRTQSCAGGVPPHAARPDHKDQNMRKLIEYTLITVDGVVEDPQSWGFASYRDDAYLRDGLGLLLSCEAMVMGRATYESNARIWPARAGQHPWADRLNEITKYVCSSTLEIADWDNTTILRRDALVAVARLKAQARRDLFTWGHGRLVEALFRNGLVDVLDLSIHPVFAGDGKTVFRPEQKVSMKLTATKTFSKGIVKLTYERP
jgi:dihydrofolate reductase